MIIWDEKIEGFTFMWIYMDLHELTWKNGDWIYMDSLNLFKNICVFFIKENNGFTRIYMNLRKFLQGFTLVITTSSALGSLTYELLVRKLF